MFKELLPRIQKFLVRLLKKENSWIWSLIAILILIFTALILLYNNPVFTS